MDSGAFDVSVLTIDGDIFELRATVSDTHLGGEEIDNRLVNHFVEKFRRRITRNVQASRRALWRLHTACERARRALSCAAQSNVKDLLRARARASTQRRRCQTTMVLFFLLSVTVVLSISN